VGTQEAFRAQFPSLADTVHLASCSQGAASLRLIAALQEFGWSLRSHGAPWDCWMEQVGTARQLFAGLIGASPDEVAIVSCASEGAYQAASVTGWRRRPVIVCSDLEFPSIAHVWLAQQRRQARVRFVPGEDSAAAAAGYAAAIGEDTGLVSVPLVSYRGGHRLPVREIAGAAHAAGARVFVDAYQAAGVLAVSVRELDCDYLVAGALKYLLGIPGLAFLYCRGGAAGDLPPELTGWFGRADPFAFDPRALDFADSARRFETGTPSIPSAYGAVAGMTTLREAGTDASGIERYVTGLAASCARALAAQGERILSPAGAAPPGPQAAIADDDPAALAEFLAARRIVTSPRGNMLRLSFHYYNNEQDVAAVTEAIGSYRARQRRLSRTSVPLPHRA
jgi:selenocysteine lyase/cysteine desulfurase